MLQFLGLCWRDLWRNRRRTILTGLVITFSVTLLIFSVALGDGAHDMMIRASTDSFIGHGQVQHSRYQDDPVLENRLEAGTIADIRQKLAGVRGIAATAPRISTGGLISRKAPDPKDPDDPAAWADMTSEGAFLLGISPADEVGVTNLHKSIVKDDPANRCLRGCTTVVAEFDAKADCEATCRNASSGFEGAACSAAGTDICAGACPDGEDTCSRDECRERFASYCEPARFLATVSPFPDNPWMGETLLGSGLASVLGVGVGDRVAVSTGTALGRTFGSIYRVAGILRTGSVDMNRTFAITQIDKLAAGLEVPNAATQLVFAVDDLDDVDEIGIRAVDALSDVPDVVALTWKQVAPDLDVFIKIDQGSMLVMITLMVMVVAVLLANVVIMAGMERTREYGIRLAMGESPNRITLGLITETMLLALLAGAVGVLIGEALVVYFSYVPIDYGMGEMESGGVVINTEIATKFRLYGLIFSMVTIMVLALVGAVVPALRIRKLKPVEAIRFV